MFNHSSIFSFFSTFPWSQHTQSNINHLNDLNDLENYLLSDNWDTHQSISLKKDIQSFIQSYQGNIEEVDTFLSHVIKATISKDPQEMFKFLSEVIPFDVLNEIAKRKMEGEGTNYQNVFALAEERALFYPKKIESTFRDRLYLEWKKCRPLVVYFIPNLLNLFLASFNFLDSNKKFTSLWEKHLLLEIVYKFFLIPFCLIHLLQPVLLTTVKVYLATAITLGGLGLLAAAYHRWLKPVPDEIVNCVNLDKLMERGLIEPKVRQKKQFKELKRALMTGSNVLLIGKSGEGKTALVHYLVQMKKEGKLPKQLQQCTNFEIDSGLLISSVSFGHSELINQIKDQIEGYEKKILFTIDEIDHLITNPGAFQAFKKRFLEDQPRPQFIATITAKQFEKIKENDTDGSFRRRVKVINIDANSDKHNRMILNAVLNHKAPTIRVTDEAIEAVLELSKKEDFLPDIGRPAKIKKIAEEVLGCCLSIYDPSYMSTDLEKAHEEKEKIKIHLQRHLENPEDRRAFRDIQTRIHALEEENERLKNQIEKIKKIGKRELTFKNQFFKLTHQLAEVKDRSEHGLFKSHVNQDAQKLYLLYCMYGVEAFKQVLDEEIVKIEDKVPVRMTENLVREVFTQLKEAETTVFS